LAGSVETRLKDSLTLRIADTSLLPIAMRIWSRDSDGVRTDTTSGPELTLRYDARGTHKLTVRSLTRWGQGYRVSRPSQPLYVEVRLYEPTALAGKDTAMAYGDTLAIMGAGTAAGGGILGRGRRPAGSGGSAAGHRVRGHPEGDGP
jgi:hypothetical protein